MKNRHQITGEVIQKRQAYSHKKENKIHDPAQ